MRTSTRLCALAATVLGVAAFAGCQSGMTAHGTTYRTQIDRSLEAQVGSSHEEVHAAALDVAADLGLHVEEEACDAFQGVITAETATGETVTIESYYLSKNATSVEIRVGGFSGDTNRSKRILEDIESRLDPSGASDMADASEEGESLDLSDDSDVAAAADEEAESFNASDDSDVATVPSDG